jgi:hypothetical protein
LAAVRIALVVEDKLLHRRASGSLQCASGDRQFGTLAALSSLIGAPVSLVSQAAAILKFLQDGQHFSLVACFAQFVHDRLRCSKM